MSINLKNPRSCAGCRAYGSGVGLCSLGYKTETLSEVKIHIWHWATTSQSMTEVYHKPVERCPKPTTNIVYKDILIHLESNKIS